MGKAGAILRLIFAVQGVCTPDPQIVDAALKTPDSAWKFIIAPDSRYLERVQVAQHASLPASFLPQVVAASRQLYREWERGVREAVATRVKLRPRDLATPIFMGVVRNVVARDHGLYGGGQELKKYADKPWHPVKTCASSSTP